MPIRIPNALPATEVLENENIFVMTETRALTQDIRTLHVLLLNLMPAKIRTETQIARLVGNTPLQVNLDLLQVSSHVSKNTSQEHMLAFYQSFEDIKDKRYDGMIITGAPIEDLEFTDVDYWDELCEIMEWSKTHVTSTLHICWGAQAGLYYHFGIPKVPLAQRLHGVYNHIVDRRGNMLFRGADDRFMAPHSRNTGNNREDIEAEDRLKILASSPRAGVFVCMTDQGRQIFISGHPEYDTDTLEGEYHRDLEAGLSPVPPVNYYLDDDPTKEPINSWRAHANLLYSNWLNYFVYQRTPYNIDDIN